MGESQINNRGYTHILPAAKAFSITPNDSNNQLGSVLTNTQTTRTIAFQVYVGVTGDVEAVLAGDSSSVVFKNVPAGTVIPALVVRVKATLTTATNLVGLY